REKVCGCCLGARGVAVVERLGVDLASGPARALALKHVRITSRGGATLELPHAGGRVLSRSVLDAALVDAAVRSGAKFRDKCSASVVERRRGYWHVMLGGECVGARSVIVADGLGGHALEGLPALVPTVARGSFMGIGAKLSPSNVDAAVVPDGTVLLVHGVGGYVGFVRMPDGTIDLAAAIDPRRARAAGGPIMLLRRIIEQARVAVRLDENVRLTGTPLLTRRRRMLSMPGLIIAGDSAGYVEPFTGEGMTWAALSGAQAGSLAAAAGREGESAIDRVGDAWASWHDASIGPMQTTCRTIRVLLRTPGLLRGVATAATRCRALRRALAQLSTRITGRDTACRGPLDSRLAPASLVAEPEPGAAMAAVSHGERMGEVKP
ncbi:MAG: NAD(P)/FAD-dependent oxidoreductase, partial [Phycisphaerales bacterium]